MQYHSHVKKNLVVICGPTASGKTHLGVALAQNNNGEIISADSRQVYKYLDIGTGKDLEEYCITSVTIPYHLIDIIEPSQIYTLYHYQRDCFRAIKDIWQRDKLAIMVGGSGLYIEAILKNYNIPNVPENPQLRKTLSNLTKEELADQLQDADPQLYQSTDRSSKKRIIRALEITTYSKKHAIQYGTTKSLTIDPLVIGITYPRSILKDRIEYRLKQRLAQGMVDEVKDLLNRNITSERLESLGLEYKYISQYLRNILSYEEMVSLLKRDIVRFSKRQMTYFRGMEKRGIPIHWLSDSDPEQIMALVNNYDFSS